MQTPGILISATLLALIALVACIPTNAQQTDRWLPDQSVDTVGNTDSLYVASLMVLSNRRTSVSFIEQSGALVDQTSTSATTATLDVLEQNPAVQCTPPPTLKSARLKARLYVGDDYNFGIASFKVEVDIAVDRVFSGAQSLYDSETLTLEVNPGTSTYSPEGLWIVDFESAYSSIDQFVIKPTINAGASSIPATVAQQLKLDVWIEEEFEWPVVSSGSPTTPLVELREVDDPNSDNIISHTEANPVTFEWQLASGCSDSIPSFEFQLLRLFNVDEEKTDEEQNITAEADWSQALSIEIDGTEKHCFGNVDGDGVTCVDGTGVVDEADFGWRLTLTIAQGTGYYAWRVRPIGSEYPGGIANDRNWGVWTPSIEGETEIDDVTRTSITDATERKGVFFYEEFDDDKNWIYTRVFSEGENRGTRVGERIQYAGYLMQSLQTQGRVASHDDLFLASQTILDYSGRPAVQTLGVPVSQGGFGYISGLMKSASGQELYRARDFDADVESGGASDSYKNPFAVYIDQSNPDLYPFAYYSNFNKDVRVPSADGYPFTRVIYSRDGTDRPREQGGVGNVHRIGGTGTTPFGTPRTVRARYGSVSDQELIWLFGDEAPDRTTVRKVISIDENEVASISYVNKMGQTIATAISAEPQNPVLSSLPSTYGPEDYDPIFPAQVTIVQDITANDNDQVTEYGLSAGYRLALDVPTLVTLEYSITPGMIEASCGEFCASCDYLVEFIIHDVEDQFLNSEDDPDPEVTEDPIQYFPARWTLEVSGAEVACSTGTSQINWNQTVTLPAGTYRVERRLRLATVDPSTQDASHPIGRPWLDVHLDKIRDEIADQLGLPTIAPNDPALQPLEALFELLEDREWIEQNGLSGFYTEVENLGYVETNGEYVIATSCCEIHIPVLDCASDGCDPSRPDFEDLLLDSWGTKYSRTNTDQFFYRNETELYPAGGWDHDGDGSDDPGDTENLYISGNGAFNALIDNMVDDGYDCEKLWSCWVGLVAAWEGMGTLEQGDGSRTVNKRFDLMEAFLLCANDGELVFDGVSDCPYGDCNLDLVDEGYLDNAHKYFKDRNAPNCRDMIENATGETYPWPAEDENWTDLYHCYKGESRQSLFDDEEVPSECSSLGSVSEINACQLEYRQRIMDQCNSVCESRFGSFVDRIIDAYHAQCKVVQGDETDCNGNAVASGVFDVSLKEIYCTARSLVDHCQTGCELTPQYQGNPPNPDPSVDLILEVGTDLERAAYVRSVQWTFEVSLWDPVQQECADPAATHVTSSGTSSMEFGELVVERLNQRLWELQAGAGVLGYHEDDLVVCEVLREAYDEFLDPGDGLGSGGDLGLCWRCDCGLVDTDLDAINDGCDNCPDDPNATQADSDGDGVGDACDVCPGGDDNYDSDGDGVPDDCDICPGSDDNVDTDSDNVPDGCDDCAGVDVSASDADGDGVPDSSDPCPCLTWSARQQVGDTYIYDHDGDGCDDGYEIQCGSDPCDAQSINCPCSMEISSENPYLDLGKATVNSRSWDIPSVRDELGYGIVDPDQRPTQNPSNRSANSAGDRGASPPDLKRVPQGHSEKSGGYATTLSAEDNPLSSDAGCPETYLPDIFDQGEGITGRFLLGSQCELIYERTCIRGETTQTDQIELCGNVCGESCTTDICFKWVEPTFPTVPDHIFRAITCEEQSARDLSTLLSNQADACIAENQEDFTEAYVQACTDPATVNDEFRIRYKVRYTHFTLYYYDRAGNLIETVQPKGVAVASVGSRLSHPDHKYATGYEYNSLGQLVRQITPDGGEARYYYDDLQRLRFSQSQRQADMTPPRFSYTKYDNLNRVVEAGEALVNMVNGVPFNDFTSMVNDPFYPVVGRKDVITTQYTVPTGDEYLHQTGMGQRHLRNRVSMRTTDEGVSTVYSYDPHGNVEWLAQYIPGLGGNFIRYEYDLISGNVKSLVYDGAEEWSDQFHQRYSYDEDQRLVMVESSRDGQIWDRDAQYEYMLHGPVGRYRIGEDKIQTVDYVYTIHGWLKGINQYPLETPFHAGGAGGGAGYQIGYARDAFAMVLGYYAGDFMRSRPAGGGMGPIPWNSAAGGGVTVAEHHLTGSNLYNGNIGSWTHQYAVPAGTTFGYQGDVSSAPTGMSRSEVTGYTFEYDVLNRLKSAEHRAFLSTTSPGYYNAATGEFDVQLSYDANGNILNLFRNGHATGGMGMNMDDLQYAYGSGMSGPNNQLMDVQDLTAPNPPGPPNTQTLQYQEDYENLLGYMPPPTGPNFTYDGSGNLVADYAEGTRVKWNAYGKIERVRRILPGDPALPMPLDFREDIYFRYNAAGNRVAKYVLRYREEEVPPMPPIWEEATIKTVGEGMATYYVRDANEQVIAVYTRELDPLLHDDPCWPDWFWPFDPVDTPDEDGVSNAGTPPCDNCPGEDNPWQEDYDGDGIGDECDNCPLVPNPGGAGCPGGEGAIAEEAPFVERFEEWENLSETDIVLAELHIYGSVFHARVGMYVPKKTRDTAFSGPFNGLYARSLREKHYEVKDHLGNVRIVLTDLKLDASGGGTPTVWNPDIVAWSNYYPFGMLQPGRYGSAELYRYGFNGKEMDNEIHDNSVTGATIGVGNHYDYGFRVYDPRIAKFLSVDPLAPDYPWYTPYQFAGNSPIRFVDLDGAEETPPPTMHSAMVYTAYYLDQEGRISRQMFLTGTPGATEDVGYVDLFFYKDKHGKWRDLSSWLPTMQIHNSQATVEDETVAKVASFGINAGVIKLKQQIVSSMIHTVLDVFGLIPFLGELADGVNALWYFAEGDYLNASLSLAGMVPFVGWASTGVKLGGKMIASNADFLKAIRKMAAAERVATVRNVAKQVAKQNGWTKDVKLSKVNNRDIYTDGKHYYSVDTENGTFEVLNKRGKHQGEVNFEGELIDVADKKRRHDIKIP